MLTLILLLVFLWAMIHTHVVQNWLLTRVTTTLSKNLHTQITIQDIDFALFNKMKLNGVLVKDLKGDTLLYSGQVRVNITDWFFFKDKIELKYIGLKGHLCTNVRTDSVWNYQFLADYFGSGDTSEKKTIQLFIRDFDASDLHLIKQDKWRGEDMELNLAGLSLDAEQLDLNRKTADNPSIENYKARFCHPKL